MLPSIVNKEEATSPPPTEQTVASNKPNMRKTRNHVAFAETKAVEFSVANLSSGMGVHLDPMHIHSDDLSSSEY